MIRACNRLLAASLVFAASLAYAQRYPTHTVKLVVPYGPGSSPDSVGRIVAQEMQQALGQPVVVANIAGALANVGTAEVARASPDGYTILLTTNTPHAANVALFKSLPFDPVKDFAPIVRLITTSMVLLVRSDFPASTLQDFIAHAKAKPGGLTAGYGSAATIVSIAKLRTAAGFKTLDVAY
ncbi:MAG: tripartite tricarboxylate transporter substrate binding protein, partial [Betaproteobacteria bacterium]